MSSCSCGVLSYRFCFFIPFFVFVVSWTLVNAQKKPIRCNEFEKRESIPNSSRACATTGYCFLLTVLRTEDSKPWNEQPKLHYAGCDEEGMVANERWRCSTMEGDPYGKEEEYDAVRIFHSIKYRDIMYFKRCCNTEDRCNQPFDMPHYWLYKERPALHRSSHYPEAGIAFAIVIFGFCRPLYQLFMNRRASREASAHRNGTLDEVELEPDLIVKGIVLQEPSPKSKIEKASGRLNIERLAEVLARLVDVEQAEKERVEQQDRMESESTTKGPRKKKSRELMFNQTCTFFQATGLGHDLMTTVRKTPSVLDSLLLRMVEHGPYAFPFKPLELMELFDKAKDLFAMDPMLLKIDGPVVIVGDIRGQYSDLHRWFAIAGWPPKVKYLFLGGVLDDDEPGSLECIALIAALKVCAPQHIFLIRGVAEMFPYLTSLRYEGRRAEAIGGAVTRMCTVLPIAAIVEGKILAVHSGITPQMKSRNRFKGATRPCSYENMPLVMRKMLFGEPSQKVRMYRTKPGARGGELFGSQAVLKICRQLQVDYVVRSRSPLPQGHKIFFDGKLISIWSAPNKLTKIGAILVVSSEGHMQIKCLKALIPQPMNMPAASAPAESAPKGGSNNSAGGGSLPPEGKGLSLNIEGTAPAQSVKTGESPKPPPGGPDTNTDASRIAKTYPTQTMTIDETHEKVRQASK